MILNWLKIYIYHVVKNKVYFLLTVLSLAIGIAAVLLSVIHYQEEVRYDEWNPDKDNIFVVESQVDADNSWMKLPYPFGAKLKELSPHVIDVSYADSYYNDGMLEYKDEKKVGKDLLSVQSNFFDFFPFEFVQGNKEQAFAQPNSAVIQDTYAAYLFRDKDPMGEVISINGANVTVSDVYTLGGKRSSFQPNLIINDADEDVKRGGNEDNWGNYNRACWIKLDNPVYKKDVEQLIYDILIEYSFKPIAKEEGITLEELLKKWGGKRKFFLHDLAGQRMIGKSWLNGTPEGAAGTQRMYIMMGLSALILVLSVFNYINLTTARMMGRGKEVGVRKTLGATRANLVGQGMFEALLTAVISLIIALVVTEVTLPWFQVFFASRMEMHFWEFLPLILLILLVVVVLVGIVPALFAASFKTLDVLRGQIGRSKKGTGFKNAMLVVQFAVAFFFMIGAYIVYQQVEYMLHKDLGFKGDQIVRISYYYKGKHEDKMQMYQSLKEEFLKVKGVEAVTTGAVKMGRGTGSSSSFAYKGNNVQAVVASMDYNFLDVYGIDLKEGRQLMENRASDSISNILLNETAVRQMQEPDVIGKEIDWNGKKYNVVGVVKDFNLYGLQAEYPPIAFISLKTLNWGGDDNISVKVKGDNVEQTIKELEKIWERRDVSDFPFSYGFVDKEYEQTFTKTIQERNVFLVLNTIVIFIALFGLYSLASFTINGRLKEVAIRKVLGASTPELLKQLSTQYVVFCLTGFAIAVFPSYYFLSQWLSDYAFRIEISSLPFVICFGLILILTLVIVLTKAYLATKLNVLKYIN